MDYSEFKNECFDYLDERFEAFNKSKEILKETLSVFHGICEKRGIHYYLAFGSLLGCVRDKRLMPPWDRDIDVVVFYEDRDRLIDALNNDLEGRFGFECEKTNRFFPYYQMHIFPKGYDPSIYHIDVFYLVKSINSFKSVDIWKRRVQKLFSRRKRKYSGIPANLDKKTVALFRAYRALYKFYPRAFLNSSFKKLSKNCPGDYCGVIGAGSEVFPTSVFGTGRLVECEGVVVRVPDKSEDFLRIRYGDYLRYLPIAARLDEFLTGSRLLMGEDK